MADKSCINGHVIDESWDLCPYCPADRSEASVAVVRPGAIRDTERPARSRPDHGARRSSPEELPPRTSVPVVSASRTTVAPKINMGEALSQRYTVGWLVGLSSPIRGESFAVRIGRNVIGRDPRSDVVVSDDQVSSHHADLIFRLDEKRYILMDHNSTNGTFVNEDEIEPRRDLQRLDVVRIGAHRFLFVPLDGFSWDDEVRLK